VIDCLRTRKIYDLSGEKKKVYIAHWRTHFFIISPSITTFFFALRIYVKHQPAKCPAIQWRSVDICQCVVEKPIGPVGHLQLLFSRQSNKKSVHNRSQKNCKKKKRKKNCCLILSTYPFSISWSKSFKRCESLKHYFRAQICLKYIYSWIKREQNADQKLVINSPDCSRNFGPTAGRLTISTTAAPTTTATTLSKLFWHQICNYANYSLELKLFKKYRYLISIME
jgi:hypothetical protein